MSSDTSIELTKLDLPEPVLDLIAQSKLTVGQSRPLLALASADAQIAAARAIVERGLHAPRWNFLDIDERGSTDCKIA